MAFPDRIKRTVEVAKLGQQRGEQSFPGPVAGRPGVTPLRDGQPAPARASGDHPGHAPRVAAPADANTVPENDAFTGTRSGPGGAGQGGSAPRGPMPIWGCSASTVRRWKRL